MRGPFFLNRRSITSLLLSLWILESFCTINAEAQEFFRDDYSIPMTAKGTPLDHPFTGGLNQPMHQFVDIDDDLDFDLFMYELNEEALFFYRNVGTPQNAIFLHERSPFIMPLVFGWFRLSDVNGDQKLDMLTSTLEANTLAIYLNQGTPAVPVFTLLTEALLDSAGGEVYAESFSIASLADIDADADPDFFSLNSTEGTINFYENIGSSSNFLLVRRTDMWQGIRICIGCGSFNRKDHYAPERHGNGSTYFADVDADNDFDMFYGDLFHPGLYFFENIGTPDSAVLDSVTAWFPPDNPVITGGFNQPILVDIDADDDVDLFVSVLFPLERVDNFRFYENEGTPQNYDFQLVTKNYLETLDLGLQAAPAFVDIDADADQDLFIGYLDGGVAFLRNTGTPTQPEFLLEDSTFIFNDLNYTYAPCFADIDSDTDMDMFLGHFTGKIEFHRNNGTISTPNFGRELWTFDTLNVGNYAFPALLDIDTDGDLDLFAGRALGTISYYTNIGSAQNGVFTLVTSSYQGIDVGDNSKPQFIDVDGDSDEDLLVGSRAGTLSLYSNDGPPGDPAFTFVTSYHGSADSVRESSPALVDIDDDGDIDLFVGNYRGGLEFYRNGPETSVQDEDHSQVPASPVLLQNYPNPFNPSTVIRFSVPVTSVVDLRVFDVLGREVASLIQASVPPGQHQVRWDAGSTTGGVYFYRLSMNGASITRKLILLR